MFDILCKFWFWLSRLCLNSAPLKQNNFICNLYFPPFKQSSTCFILFVSAKIFAILKASEYIHFFAMPMNTFSTKVLQTWIYRCFNDFRDYNPSLIFFSNLLLISKIYLWNGLPPKTYPLLKEWIFIFLSYPACSSNDLPTLTWYG